MAEEAPAPAWEAPAAGKMTMVVGVDYSEPSYFALQWVLHHFFPLAGQSQQYRLIVVAAKPAFTPVVGPAGPGGAPVLFVDADLSNKAAARVIDKAKELCAQQQVSDAEFEVVEGDPRNMLCEAVETHNAEMLAVGQGNPSKQDTASIQH